MKKMINRVTIQGKLYDHDLQLKVTGATSKSPNTEFISGSIHIATDDGYMNVVPVHFTYVTESTKNGVNRTWNVLKSIIDGSTPTVVGGGDAAVYVQADTNLALNEWYDKDDKLVSIIRNEGGFVKTINEADLLPENKRATFAVDMVINGCARIDANEERNLPEKVEVRGAIFNYRNELMPVKFSMVDPKGMDYFEGLDASSSHPVFTEVRGIEVSQTSVQKITEDSAFGDPSVREVKRSYKDYVLTWAKPEEYEWDSEDTLLAADLSKMMADREIHLADVKKRQDEYQASKNVAKTATVAPTKGTYTF